MFCSLSFPRVEIKPRHAVNVRGFAFLILSLLFCNPASDLDHLPVEASRVGKNHAAVKHGKPSEACVSTIAVLRIHLAADGVFIWRGCNRTNANQSTELCGVRVFQDLSNGRHCMLTLLVVQLKRYGFGFGACTLGAGGGGVAQPLNAAMHRTIQVMLFWNIWIFLPLRPTKHSMLPSLRRLDTAVRLNHSLPAAANSAVGLGRPNR